MTGKGKGKGNTSLGPKVLVSYVTVLEDKLKEMLRVFDAVEGGGGGSPIKFGWGCDAGFAKVLPFTRPNFANFVTLYQTKKCSIILDFSLL